MGSIVKSVSKAVKGVATGFTKAVKSTVKRVKKVGKAVMKGVAKISNKLGPIGMIALSIAMPYALAGLSSMTTAAMGSTNGFLQAIGNVGGAIRTGYQGFNAFVSKGVSSITGSISQAFQNFAPQGVKDVFSSISQGAQNLYSKAKETVAKYTPKPFTAKEGTVQFFDDDGIQLLKSSDAANLIQKNPLDVSRLGEQTLSGKAGFFTKANPVGVEADKLVTEIINEAYKPRLENFSPNSTKMFTDIKNYTKDIGTYVNDEQIGSFIENNAATTQSRLVGGPNTGGIVTTDTDLVKTGDYNIINEAGKDDYVFTGKETFKSPPVKSAFEEAAKKSAAKATSAAKGFVSSLLTPTPAAVPIAQPAYYNLASSGDMMNTAYGGTNIAGSQGGSLVAKVFGNEQANQIKTYYQNMNILGSIYT